MPAAAAAASSQRSRSASRKQADELFHPADLSQRRPPRARPHALRFRVPRPGTSTSTIGCLGLQHCDVARSDRRLRRPAARRPRMPTSSPSSSTMPPRASPTWCGRRPAAQHAAADPAAGGAGPAHAPATCTCHLLEPDGHKLSKSADAPACDSSRRPRQIVARPRSFCDRRRRPSWRRSRRSRGLEMGDRALATASACGHETDQAQSEHATSQATSR